MIFEGDIFLFTAAFLVSRGILDLGQTLIVILTGETVGDSLWYWFGRKLNHSQNKIT